MQHRKIKNPQAYTLSVDLFGPMPPVEKGRDEQSVSGKPTPSVWFGWRI